jgi:ubiquinone/menaquinone biosynthesis C-methylase UbiE
MDILTRLQIIKYHQDAIIKFGINSKEALGWKNEKNQLARFNALYNINDLNNHSVLDLGCGIGDFLELSSKRFY